jgi:hypothetical protein
MKKFTIIFTLLLVPAIAFPWAGNGASLAEILADFISSNLQINSLGVGVAATGVAGEADIDKVKASTGYYGDTTADAAVFPQGLNTGTITAETDFVRIHQTGTTNPKVVEWYDADGVAIGQLEELSGKSFMKIDYFAQHGGNELNFRGTTATGNAFLKFGGSVADFRLEMPTGNRLTIDNSTTASEVFSVNDTGSVVISGSISPATANLGSVGTNAKAFTTGHINNMYVETGYYGNTHIDPSIHPRGVQTANGAGISIGGTAPTTNAIDFVAVGNITPSPSENVGRLLYYGPSKRFYMQTSTGASSLGLGMLRADIDVQCGSIKGLGAVPAPAPYGIIYPEQTAPSAPSSGSTVYHDSTSGNLTAKNASGYLACLPIPSFGKIFEENETGSTITVATAGTYYPWITAEAGSGTGSTGGDTITTSVGNPSSITIEGGGVGYYKIDWHAGVDAEGGAIVHGAIFKNGSRILPTTNHIESEAAGKINFALSGGSIVYLEDGDVLTLQFTSDTNGDDVNIFHASLTAFRISCQANL